MKGFQLKLDLFEEWLPIENYEDLYQVSNWGRVKSLNYRHTNQEQILKQINDKDGYQQIRLYKDGKGKTFKVHRLVAMAFIQNPNNYTEINHKDECKTNNRIDNLEWCNRKYNVNFGTRNERCSGENHPMFGNFGKKHPSAKQIIQLTLNGEVVRKWDSAMDVKRELGYNQGNISSCCRGEHKSAYNYKWQFA